MSTRAPDDAVACVTRGRAAYVGDGQDSLAWSPMTRLVWTLAIWFALMIAVDLGRLVRRARARPETFVRRRVPLRRYAPTWRGGAELCPGVPASHLGNNATMPATVHECAILGILWQ